MSHDAQDWWDTAITRNRAALLRIVAVLFVYAGLDEGGAETVPRRVWRKILAVLCPAESAVRRLIVIAARDIEIEPPKPRAEKPLTGIERLVAVGVLTFREVNLGLACAPRSEPAAAPEKSAPRIPAFPLSDPPRRFDAKAWDGLRPFPQDGFALADGDEEVGAAALCRRLQSLKDALDNLDRHARRLARRRARENLASRSIQGRFAPASEAQLKGANHRETLRLGHPPGHRKRLTHPVADVLRECHGLALSLPRQRTDTS